MNAVAKQFDGLNHRIVVPRSIPPLVTQRLLVMDFIDGAPLDEALRITGRASGDRITPSGRLRSACAVPGASRSSVGRVSPTPS